MPAPVGWGELANPNIGEPANPNIGEPANPNAGQPVTPNTGASAGGYVGVRPSPQPTLPKPGKPLPTRLIVRSNVSGGTVTIDGNPVGSTGPHAYQLAPGEHKIRVEKAGFKPFETTVQLSEGRKKTVRVTLKKAGPYANWRRLRTIPAHPGELDGAICERNCIAFAPNGESVLSGSHDKTMKLWEVATGKENRAFQWHSDYVNSVAFAPDGRTVLSGGGGT
uniref:WD domain-containing protein, G-beta repeat-containing protein n=1 Tax=Candidatus Kentrum sp. FW TaxID=2126338 RepID=A0A450SNF0_9GAMM|nr:MAG: WD domain-containing protein, G-beta repeat-containing protein [Candidatus Kentron sp. FW]